MFHQARNIIFSTILLFFVAQACHAELMCYVCEDCAKINAETPLLACNEGYFSQAGTTMATTVTTTAMPNTTETSTTPTTMPTSSTTAEMTTTEQSTATSEEPTTTGEMETTESTQRPMPTPPTVGPVVTTTGVPTPPTEDLLARSDSNATNLTDSNNFGAATTTTEASAITTTTNRTYTASSEFRVRQARSTIDTDVSYHCYTVQKKVNATMITERGCSRVTTMQGVCSELQTMNTGVELANCDPCTMSKCNGSGALAVSAATMIFAIIAGLMSRN